MQIEIFDGHSDLLTELATTYRLTGQVDFQSKYLTTFQQGCMGGSIFVAWADNELAIPLAKQIEDIFTVEKLLADTGMQDVTVKLYPEGRHEMLNEINRDEVMADLERIVKEDAQRNQ